MRRRYARARITVAKIPSISQCIAVRVGGSGGVEIDKQRRSTRRRISGALRYGRLRGFRYRDDRRLAIARRAVAYGQRGSVSADRSINVVRTDARGGISVAEIPGVGQRIAVRIRRSGGIEGYI